MTALTVIQKAAVKIGISRPTAVFSETSRTALELQEHMHEAAQDILKTHDWELLKTLQTMTGDGSAESFTLPTDYDRMSKDAKLWHSNLETPLRRILSDDEWLELDVRSYDFVVGVWIKLGGNILIKPAVASADTVKFYYISNLIVTPSVGDDLTTFAADSDTFRLDERLLKLGLIWRWLAAKGRPYAEEMHDYETHKERLINEDKGFKIVRAGRMRMTKGLRVAYPRPVTA